MKLSKPKPTSETDPANQSRDDGDESFERVVADREVLQRAATLNMLTSVACGNRHKPSM